MDKRVIRERLIDAALLSLAHDMERRSPEAVLKEIFGPDIQAPLEVFVSMMRRRELWDPFLNGTRSRTPPETEDETEYVYIPGRAYPNVGNRPVRWGTITKVHYSQYPFSESPNHPTMHTVCGLTIRQLAVILPEKHWHPGSDETCKMCAPAQITEEKENVQA
jgi:hypothetical protein